MKRLGIVAVVAVVVVAFAVPFPGAAADAPFRRAIATLTIVNQDAGFNVAADGTFAIIVEAPPSLALVGLSDADVVVTSYGRVDGRAALEAALDGDLPRSVDTVDIAFAETAPATPQRLSISVPIETSTRGADALQLPRAGLYPVIIDVRSDGEVVGEVLTFVNRLPPSGDEVITDLNVAIAVGTTEEIGLTTDGRPIVSDVALAEVARLVEVIDASALPVTVRIPASMVAAIRSVDPDLADELAAALGQGEVVSSPVLPLNPSSAASAGQQALYTQWFREGEDLLGTDADVRATRTISFVNEPLDTAGATLLRDLGSRLLVLTTELYDPLVGSIAGFTDTTQLIEVQLEGTATLDAALPDRRLAELLARPSADPVRTAVIAVADLLATRTQINDGGGVPHRHSVLLATPELGLPAPDTLATISNLIAATPGLRTVTVDELGSRTDTLVIDGGEVSVTLPTSVGTDISRRVTIAASLLDETTSIASMLAADDARLAAWDASIERMPTGALDDAQVNEMAAAIRSEHVAIRASVEPPPPFSFVLTGRSSMIRLRVRNTASTPITVRLRLASTKLVFPKGDQLVELAPGSFTEVEIPVEARSNGRFPVSLEIFTPIGDNYVTEPIPLTASVNALSGLGNLITGAGLLILLAWWGHHLRKTRRYKRSVNDAQRLATDDTGEVVVPEVIDDSDLSPDAATSTLPP